MANRGVVYACSHERWFPETLVSAESCRRQMPDLPRHIFVTRDLGARFGDQLAALFSAVVVLDDSGPSHRPRFEATRRAQLDEAIFIDGDTYFVRPVPELFDVLQQFDIGVAAAPQYLSPLAVRTGVFERLPKVSPAIPEWNTGVIVARLDDGFRSLIERWDGLFADCIKMGFTMDQASFRSALALSRLRVLTLPNNYNFRALVAQNVAGEVKILHAHGELKRIGETINASTGMRLYSPKPELIHGFHPK